MICFVIIGLITVALPDDIFSEVILAQYYKTDNNCERLSQMIFGFLKNNLTIDDDNDDNGGKWVIK